MKLRLISLLAALAFAPLGLSAQQSGGPLELELTQGVFEPLPIAIPSFEAETPEAAAVAFDITRLVARDLTGTGLFREIPAEAFISDPGGFAAPVAFNDWRSLNARAVVKGAVSVVGTQMIVKFRVFDVLTGAELQGQQMVGQPAGWRRMAHKVADQAYSKVTGEGPYFDSRIVYVSETGPKDDRRKRLAIMDYDGANLSYLTDSRAIVIAPRFSPDGQQVLFTSYDSGFPRINLIDVASVRQTEITTQPGEMAFSPRFSRDGTQVIYSLANGGNTDIWRTDLRSGQHQRLTEAPSIETSPSFSPDGGQIVFESDKSGTQQLYIMPSSGGEARRISFGEGRYGTPVWSPRGDLIAFTKQAGGAFHIGVMRTDGSEERLLTRSRLDEGPTWSPNGRVIMFTRETGGAGGTAALMSVDITGRNLAPVPVSGSGSDPSWGPLQP